MKGSRFAGPSESPGFLLWQVTNAWQREIRAALAPLDLTHVQFVLLACLGWTTDETPTRALRITDLLRRLDGDPSLRDALARLAAEASNR